MVTKESILGYRIVFGRHVQERRKQQSLTQGQLERMTGVRRSTISRIENGSCNVKLDTVLQLASALDATPSELFSGIGERTRVSSAELPAMLGMRERGA